MLRGIITMSLVVGCATEIHHLSWGGSTFGLPILDRGANTGPGVYFWSANTGPGPLLARQYWTGSTTGLLILDRVLAT